MTPQNTPASDEENRRATLKRVMEYLYSMSDEEFAREIEIRKEGDVAMIMREVLEARTESRDDKELLAKEIKEQDAEITKLRELLERAMKSHDSRFDKNLEADYAALTKGNE